MPDNTEIYRVIGHFCVVGQIKNFFFKDSLSGLQIAMKMRRSPRIANTVMGYQDQKMPLPVWKVTFIRWSISTVNAPNAIIAPPII